jgi:hypothetical protein
MRTRTLLRFDPPWSGIFQVNMLALALSMAPIEEWERAFQHAMSVQTRHADERRTVMEDSRRRAVE